MLNKFSWVQFRSYKMEDDLSFSGDGRGPHYFWKWKTTSIFYEIKDTSIHQEIEDNLLFSGNGRRLEFSEYRRRLKFSENWIPPHYQLMSNISIGQCWFWIPNQKQFATQSISSFTWAWHSSAPACLALLLIEEANIYGDFFYTH